MTEQINLALQGGGAHGAFTWGVLDRLLESDAPEIAGISGTSAGALNGAALKAGLLRGGSRQAARDNLDWLWEEIGALPEDSVPGWLDAWLPDPGIVSKSIEYSFPYAMGQAMGDVVSPYMSGPFYRNPLEPIVKRFDFSSVCADEGPAFFVCATKVRDGKIRIFKGKGINPDALMASACLPTLFRAVDVTDPETGETDAYWDGGYSGNPALFPLFNKGLPDDIVIVNINPLRRETLPMTPPDIRNRINEISFNASLLSELRAIDFVHRLLKTGALQPGTMKAPRIHMIADDELMNSLSVATKTIAVPTVLSQLKSAGRKAAGLFLDEHLGDIGARQTADLRRLFA